MKVSGEDISGRGNSECKGPEVGVCLACSSAKWPVNLEQSEERRNGERESQRREGEGCRRSPGICPMPYLCIPATVFGQNR